MMKSQLSHLLPVADAHEILGADRVEKIIRSFLCMQQQSQPRQAVHGPNASTTQRTAYDIHDQLQTIDQEAHSLSVAMSFTGATKPASSRSLSSSLQQDANSSVGSGSTNDGLGIENNNNNNGTNDVNPNELVHVPSTSNPQLVHQQLHDPEQRQHAAVPSSIRHLWKKLSSRPMMLDKLGFRKFVVPTSVQPHTGQGGHMGLFDCLFYALQVKPGSPMLSSTGVGGASPLPNANPLGPALVSLPDICIFLAICKGYSDLQQQQRTQKQEEEDDDNDEEEEEEEDDADSAEDDEKSNEENEITKTAKTSKLSSKHPCIVRMIQWMFFLYDSYQKKGTVTRDTLERFLIDVHGEENTKGNPMIQNMLDSIFPNAKGGTPQAVMSSALTSREFCHVIGKSISLDPYPSHVLIDWMATLGSAMVPPVELSESTTEYLQTMDQELRWLPQICAQYGLAENRLFEVKRRFHSLVESSSTVIQGDPMMQQQQDDTAATDTTAKQQPQPPTLPKHVISLGAFTKAVCPPNDELGHGGYLPQTVAKKVFYGATRSPHFKKMKIASSTDVSTDGSATNDDSPSSSECFWDLTHVLQFGGTAVRSSPDEGDIPLVRWIVGLFGTSPLTRSEIGDLIVCLCDHYQYRAVADTPKRQYYDYDDHDTGAAAEEQEETSKSTNDKSFEEKDVSEKDGNGEARRVDLYAASLLGLLPKHLDESMTTIKENNGDGESSDDQKTATPDPPPKVALHVLIDHLLKEAGSKTDTLSGDELSAWHNNEPAEMRNQRRLGPLITELRLVASVLFGIPPKLASMEHAIILELVRRHRFRYPQTDVSRRGPRGTVWYIIDDLWYRTWLDLVKRVSNTPDDYQDDRNKLSSGETTPRGLGRISNRGLLRENGSLALRTDIKWRTDYEIIPPLSWSALQAWYDGGPPIHRTVVPFVPSSDTANPHNTRKRIQTENEIELFPFFVTIFMCDAASRGEARPFQQTVPMSRVSPVGVLLVQLCKGMDVDPKFGRLWVMETAARESTSTSMMSASLSMSASEPLQPSVNDWLLELETNIVDQRKNRSRPGDRTGAGSNITILLELKDEETGLWPRGIDGKQWSFRDKNDPNASEIGDGVVGLYNMGNTCYLNSSIQCLSHTPIFRDYFTSKCYLNDINTTNPLGHQGRLAQVSAVLINSLWKRFSTHVPHQPKRVTAPGSYATVNAPALTPKTFKESLGKFNDHFAGNEQHDAQELLAFILGGLSEDLNRIVDKPYIEAPDSDGRPDSELADIWWSNHLKREMSIVVALFTGQYKSLLTCRSCKYESARFEPFSFLQLPLPEDDHISVSLVLYPTRKGVEPMKYSVRVHNNGTLHDVLLALAKILHVDEMAEAAASAKDENDGEGRGGSPKAQPTTLEHLDEAEKERLEQIYHRRAANMAVVDMRDFYIFKIAPNSWALPDLQIKDTGELPLVHVYELDPLPANDSDDKSPANDHAKKSTTKSDSSDSSEKDSSKDNKDDENDEADKTNEVDATDNIDSEEKSEDGDESDDDINVAEPRYSFLAVAQRRSEQMSKDGLHPLVHQIFGTPLLLRVVDLEGHTGRDVYDLVAKRVWNFVPPAARSFLASMSNLSSSDADEKESVGGSESGAAATERQPRLGSRQRLRQTLTDMEEVAAGPVPRYGFRLRISSRDGRRCGLCPWYNCCIGCLVPDDDYPAVVMCGDSIVIDWHFAVDVATSGFGTRSNQVEQTSTQTSPFRSRLPSVSVKNHSSCGIGAKQKGYAGAITLEDCLDAFAKEEKIPEAYCSKCKDFRVQTKRMSLWRLPPVVIIQLKRFQFTQQMRRKLRDFVAFPVEGLDLSRIMAADSCGGSNQSTGSPKKRQSPSEESSSTNPSDDKGGKEPNIDNLQNHKQVISSKTNDDDHNKDETATAQDDTTADTSSSSPPLNATNDSGRSEMLYDLYGVVHHQGALSGGHYVASLKSELDGQWRLFNDAQIYEIHSRDVVDSSAYILFYIRQDVMNAKLSDFWDTSHREGEGLTEEDMDKLIRGRSDRCVIS